MSPETLKSNSPPEFVGTGTALWGERKLPISFSLRPSADCAPTIDATFHVDRPTTYELLNHRMNLRSLENCQIEGVTNEGYSLSCALAECDLPDCDLRFDPPIITCRFDPKDKIIVRRANRCDSDPKSVIFGVLNMESDSFSPLRALHFEARGRTIEATRLQNYDDLRSALSDKKLPRAVTHELSVSFAELAEMDELEDIILTITMMLSLVQMNDIKPYCSVVLDTQGSPVQWIYYTHLRSAQHINFFKMISDQYVPGGTSAYVTQCFEEFDRLHKAFNLYPFLHSQLFAARTVETHFIMLALITSIEYLVTHYGLTFLNWESEAELDFIPKLRKLNDDHLRSISSKFMNPKFMWRVRNPLMHMGIVKISNNDLLTSCYDLHHLSTNLFLKLVGYKGKYLTPEWPPKVLPLEAGPAPLPESGNTIPSSRGEAPN